MKNNKLLFICLLGAVGACSAKGYKLYSVDGAKGDFCVPQKNVIPDIWWVPKAKPGAPKGFSFQSCWRPDLRVRATCTTPFLTGVDVRALSQFKGWQWENIPADAFFRTVASDSGSKLEVLDAGSIVVVSNPKLTPNWYVWKKAIAVLGGATPQLTNGDQVIAACQQSDVSIPHTSDSRKAIFCSRTIRLEDVVVDYHFESEGVVPRDWGNMDVAVASQLDKMRCPKK